MSTLDTKENENNWFLGAKGLEVLQEGLRGFIGEKIIACREEILKSLPPESPKQCSECTSDNLLPGHFEQKHKYCLHRNHSKCYGYGRNTNLRRTCPNKLCSYFYDKIVIDHATRNPLLTNTDPNKWCTDVNGWNYAKCFQTTKNTGLSAEQTDASGSLQILIHNSRIQQFLDCSDVGAEDSPFKKALDIRNEIFHKPKLEIEESTLSKYFETFIEVLQDKKCLINDERAKTAVKKLQELEKNRPTIYKTDVDRLLKKRDEVLHELEEFAQKLQDNIEEKITKEFIARGVDEIQKNAIPPRFKEELIQWYIKNKLSLQLSMTDDSVDAVFEDLYVKQELFDHTTGKLEKIKSLKDLFTSNVKVSLDIFLCSTVGAGNTTFAKYLTKLWCQSHGQGTDHNDCFQEEDLKALRDIDFVFLLNLTDSSSKCDTKDMIYDQIIQNLPCNSSYEDSKSFLKQVLNKKRCLIILDESDRWKHPCNTCTKPFKGIPHRYASENIIVLTIARQRKLVKINNSQINKEIQINWLGDKSKKQLIINALKRIAENKNEIVTEEELQNQQKAFQNKISEYNLDELASVPLILMHLVCLWHDNCFKEECQVYGKIIEMLLSRTKNFQYCQSPDKELLDGLGNLALHSFKGGKTISMSFANNFLNEEQAKLCLMSGILSESNGKICSEENDPEIYFTFETIREHFRQRLQKRE